MAQALRDLAQMRKIPSTAKLIGSVVGLLLGCAEGAPGALAGVLPPPAPWLATAGSDPDAALAALKDLSPDAVSPAALHGVLAFCSANPELHEGALRHLQASQVPDAIALGPKATVAMCARARVPS
jgi:hypothetical protein